MLRRLGLAMVLATLSIGAYATDYSDIWWNPAESGWGINLAQSNQFIFATFFVYGPGNVPTWYAGTLTLDGTGAFTGPLFTTTGTYLGTVPFDPTQSTATPVGTATFRPSAADKGTLTYNVGPVNVTKNIQRQALTAIPLAGSYTGGASLLDSACANPAKNGSANIAANITVTQSAGQIRLVADIVGFAPCTFASTGPVTQNGQLYSFAGTTACGTDPPYAVSVYELRATSLGIEGRWTAPNVGGCREDGRFSGVVTY